MVCVCDKASLITTLSKLHRSVTTQPQRYLSKELVFAEPN